MTCPFCRQAILASMEIDISLHHDRQNDRFIRISERERCRLDLIEKNESHLQQNICKLYQTCGERVKILEQRIHDLDKEISKFRQLEQESQQNIASLLQKIEQLQTTLKMSTQVSQHALSLNDKLKYELERQNKVSDEKDKRVKQYEMVIDLLNQKLRASEGQFNRLSKKFNTLIREE